MPERCLSLAIPAPRAVLLIRERRVGNSTVSMGVSHHRIMAASELPAIRQPTLTNTRSSNHMCRISDRSRSGLM